ncbi:hypothetical protein MTF64_12675 [Pseudoalteromonas sp. 2CM41L]|uniref:hypothetical protein n=1 Tax=Pseudoalteromonas sp. 2CM41L TaxID=2929857 RepID=UPI0020BF4FAA|nr:hypothetical protein [Pseudoalteromonas sp. 2CM41L]MCK8107731.1 hypothetical protein [Pseudoalteromonas sp. 2CM41L]
MSNTATEKAKAWFDANPKYKKVCMVLDIHLSQFYTGSTKWRKDATVKLVFGMNQSKGRVSVTPNKNNVRIRFAPLNSSKVVNEEFINIALGELPSDCVIRVKEVDNVFDYYIPINATDIQPCLANIDKILDRFEFDGFRAPSAKCSTDIWSDNADAKIIRRKLSEFTSVVLREQEMERRFVNWLKASKGIHARSQDTDGLFRRDVVYTEDNKYVVAELKYTNSVIQNIEMAVGQLLRYTLHPDIQKQGEKLIVVSGGFEPTDTDFEFFKNMDKVIDLELGFIYESPENSGDFIEFTYDKLFE